MSHRGPAAKGGLAAARVTAASNATPSPKSPEPIWTYPSKVNWRPMMRLFSQAMRRNSRSRQIATESAGTEITATSSVPAFSRVIAGTDEPSLSRARGRRTLRSRKGARRETILSWVAGRCDQTVDPQPMDPGLARPRSVPRDVPCKMRDRSRRQHLTTPECTKLHQSAPECTRELPTHPLAAVAWTSSAGDPASSCGTPGTRTVEGSGRGESLLRRSGVRPLCCHGP